jgi:hypothetical protein
MKGLMVELDSDSLHLKARELCTENDKPELLNEEINHITYVIEEPQDAKSRRKRLNLIILKVLAAWILFFLVVLGLYKFGEII